MCGIIGIVNRNKQCVVQDLLHSLKRLEYRGYDSMGLATLYKGGFLACRVQGKWEALREKLYKKSLERPFEKPLEGTLGIGHTRWATHGKPLEKNAHPQLNSRVAVVHNGIIDNFHVLKKTLCHQGFHFESDTDTEVVVHLLTRYLHEETTPLGACSKLFQTLEGSFSLALLINDLPFIVAGKKGHSPLSVGRGKENYTVGSDAIALGGLAQEIAYLEDGDWAVIAPHTITIHHKDKGPVEKSFGNTPFKPLEAGHHSSSHILHQEIFQQPAVINTTLRETIKALPDALPLDMHSFSRITFVACGTSYFAALVGKYWIEKWARIPCQVEIASEFRYNPPPLFQKELVVFISQSGETADILASAIHVKANRQHLMALVNMPQSSLDRLVTTRLYTHAGPEISVASTKAFTSQLMVLALFALEVAHQCQKGGSFVDKKHQSTKALEGVGALVSSVLEVEPLIQELGEELAKAKHVFFLGRGLCYPLALEGALKLKELSYMPSQGYAAGEIKHGPMAIIEKGVWAVALAPFNACFEKNLNSIQEILARGSRVVVITDKKGKDFFKTLHVEHVLCLPLSQDTTLPFLYTPPLQLLAYHVALAKGNDIDQPRHLAKSVTVE